MTTRRRPRFGVLRAAPTIGLVVALAIGVALAAPALVVTGCGEAADGATGGATPATDTVASAAASPAAEPGRERRPGAGHRPAGAGAARQGRRPRRRLPHDRAAGRGRGLDAAAHDHGLQRHHGPLVAAVRRGAGAGARGGRVRQPRDGRDRRSRRRLPVLATRRRQRRAHQGARLRQDGRAGLVDGRRRGSRPGRALPAGRGPARQLRRRRRRLARRPDEQEDARRADRHVGHRGATRHAPAHAALSAGLSQRKPGLRRKLPDPHRADVDRPRSSFRTARSARGRACGAASRASPPRHCSSRAPTM